MNDRKELPVSNSDGLLKLVLRAGTFLCFLGWWWVHYYWQGPYGILFWGEGSFALAEQWGLDWEAFAGEEAGQGVLQRWFGRVWWLYLLCVVASLWFRRSSKLWKWQAGVLCGGAGLLVLLFYCKYVASQGQLPMFVEHGGQMLMPILLVLAVIRGVRDVIVKWVGVVAMITTFAGHGAYALGLWPTPGHYYAMTSVILGWEYEASNVFLRTAGVLDMVVCLGVLLPTDKFAKVRRWSAGYAFVWGLLTALARPVAGMKTDLIYWGADQYLQEAVLRAPHFLIPLFLFLLWRGEKKKVIFK